MKKIEASLIITTTTLTLAEISSRLGCVHSSGSHEKGAPRLTGSPFDQTIWRLSPGVGCPQALEEQFKSITSQLQAGILRRPGVLPENSEVYFDIAVYFDSPMATLSIPLTCVDMARSYSADIEVSCYPSDFEPEGKSKKNKLNGEERRSRTARRSRR